MLELDVNSHFKFGWAESAMRPLAPPPAASAVCD
jgi:hypothetical protein